MIKRPLIKALANASIGASLLVSVAANAAYTATGVPALVTGFPTDMASWLANPTAYSWNPVNVRLGTHPDRSLGVVYIFPDATSANTWWDGTGSPPAGIPDDAVAYIHWKLDNNSGEFPGIMAKTDDFKFKTNNCLMASGTTIPTEDGTGTEPKTCGNYQGSSKRFKFVLLKADVPIDLVFNTTTKNLVYSNYDQADVQNDIFRIYRYIMKFGNGTGTDSVSQVRDGTRLVGFKVELGYGLGPNPGDFTASTIDESDGLAYELTLCIEDKYFDESSGQPNPGTSDCPAGETELWLENEFATFSPSMYSLTTDKRTTPVGGYWDKFPAGIYAPQTQQANLLDAGFAAYIPNQDSFGGAYDPFPPAGQIGQTTSNYFDVGASQASGAQIPDNMFGYLMYYGVFADGDAGNISMGIYRDDDGDPATEGSLHAWWDGSSPTCCFRWGIDPDRDGNNAGTTTDPNAWGILTAAELAEIASRPLDEHVTLPPPRYEFGHMDDLGGLNSDTFIKLTPAFTGNQFTIRFTAQSTAAAGLADTAPGVADAPWVATPVPADADFFDAVPPPRGDDDSGWCSYNPNGRFDPILPGLLLAGLAYLGWRLKKKGAK